MTNLILLPTVAATSMVSNSNGRKEKRKTVTLRLFVLFLVKREYKGRKEKEKKFDFEEEAYTAIIVEIWDLFCLLCPMRTFITAESCKEAHPNALNPQSWLQVERGKLPKLSSQSSSASIESLIKVPQPPIVPFFKPVDYVEVCRGLGDVKLMRRSLRSAWQRANTVHEKIIYGAWLKYEKQGEELVSQLLTACGKCEKEFGPIDVSSQDRVSTNGNHTSEYVIFTIGDEKIVCDRQKISELSAPFHAMLKGCFRESVSETIDLSENSISPSGMRAISYFSLTGSLLDVPSNLLVEILVFANKYCCGRLKQACDRRLASLVLSREDALELIEYAVDQNSAVLVASCLQVLLRDIPNCLSDNRVVELFIDANRQQLEVMVGPGGIFALFSFFSEVSMNLNSSSDTTAHFLERLVDFAENDKQRLLAFHQLGCVRFLRKEYDEAYGLFERALNAGHIYSVVGLARLDSMKGEKLLSYEKISSVISSATPLGWMYQERSLYCDGDLRWKNLEKATELDPTLVYPYMYRAASLMRTQNVRAALAEINWILGFKLSLECLELRFFIYLALEDYKAALRDVQAILTLCPSYKMFEGRVAASQLCTLVREHVEHWTTADCWAQLYDCWSAVDDIESLSVIYQMLESDLAKGVLYFRQSLLLLRLNCPEAAMRSLQLAWQHASSDHERLVYEGWILYDTGHYEEGLQKAEESISIKRSFEAYFLKAYALADSSVDSSCSSTVISLLEDALKCPSDNLRKGQALNNLGSVYVDCGKLDLAEDCYIKALKIQHSRAHQGLARVHFLKNDKAAAYKEMTNLIEKARNNASAYEKRSEYGDRELTRADLEMVTRLDPLRVYPYRYRAAVLMDSHKEEEAIAELSRAIAFKADLHLLHLRAAFHEHKGDVLGALRDCRAALSVDPNHQKMLELHCRVNSHEP
ncbi:ETO1-like protein 1, partial [Mucuna pruriens]